MMELVSEDTRRDPYPLYHQLRSSSPVLHVPQADAWMVFDYDGVNRVLTDHDSFRSSMPGSRGNPEWFIFFDPPRHTQLRGLIARAFTPRMVANLEPRIRALSRELLEQTIERGEMDLATEFSTPLPLMVIAEMFGAPVEDRGDMRRWSDVILQLSYTLSGGAEADKASKDYAAVTVEMGVYLAALIEQRRTAPRDDLLTGLIQAEVDGQRLTEREILGFFQLLLIAGHETTTNLLNNAFLSLVENPQQLARLRTSPELLPAAIEEVLRYRSPVQYMFRATKSDVVLHGQTIPAGKLVLPVIGAANRDPAKFRDPDRFDIARDPNPHIAFGHGIHFCLGAALSRLEGRIALTDLLERLGDFERSSSEPWEPRAALHVLGPARLPIRFAPSRRAVAERPGAWAGTRT